MLGPMILGWATWGRTVSKKGDGRGQTAFPIRVDCIAARQLPDFKSAQFDTVESHLFSARRKLTLSYPAHGLQKSDVWSCGVLLFILLTGRSPFQRPKDATLLTRMQRIQALLRVSIWVPARLAGAPASIASRESCSTVCFLFLQAASE